MPPRKRAAALAEVAPDEPLPKRRSQRRSQPPAAVEQPTNTATARSRTTAKSKPAPKPATKAASKKSSATANEPAASADRAASEDPDVASIPTVNPEAPRHSGEWYWLMKAEPESRIENGIDVKFSIDDLRAKTEPEGWDGIRSYAARNAMRQMNAGDKAFFYHSNCKEPGIVGIMEIVKEFQEDRSSRRPGTAYYDPKAKPGQWSLVYVEFRKKFKTPVSLKELRNMGTAGGPLETMEMLKQSRKSVSRVSAEEFKAICSKADELEAES